MSIHEASINDMDVLIDFQRRMALETENIVLDENIITNGIRNLLIDASKGKYYVAEEGKKIIGCLMTTLEWSDWRNGTVLWIQSVFVEPAHRGQGVYQKMYEHIRNEVTMDSSLTGIRLYVDKRNSAAQRVYQKLGMDGEHYQMYEWMKE